MDSMTIIAVASIVIAGITTGFGTMGPALAEGRAVATALTFAGPAARRLRHHHPDPVRRSGDDRVHGHLLFRGLDDSDFRQSVLESRHRPSRRKVTHAHRLVHRRCAGAQLPHPGVVDEALSLQAHPPRHRRAGEADRRGARGRRREKGRSPKGARRVPAQERGVRPAARRTLEQGDGRGESRTSAAPRRSAAGGRRLECQAAGSAEKRHSRT